MEPWDEHDTESTAAIYQGILFVGIGIMPQREAVIGRGRVASLSKPTEEGAFLSENSRREPHSPSERNRAASRRIGMSGSSLEPKTVGAKSAAELQ
jgi:hypothetical protein